MPLRPLFRKGDRISPPSGKGRRGGISIDEKEGNPFHCHHGVRDQL